MGTLRTEKVDYTAYSSYLKESEAELVKLGITKCNRMRDQSQLTAVVFLLIRGASLFRSVLSLLKNGQLDACDAVRRAYLETWLLAFEFRLQESKAKTALWHEGKGQSWKANLQRLAPFLTSQGVDPKLKDDYSGLSEMAHPTKLAASNSAVLVTAPLGGVSELNKAKDFLEGDIPMMMYRFLWLIIEERKGLIPLEVNMSVLPSAVRYVSEYAKTNRVNRT